MGAFTRAAHDHTVTQCSRNPREMVLGVPAMQQGNVGNSRVLQADFRLMMFCRQGKRARISVQKAGLSQQLYAHSVAGIDHVRLLRHADTNLTAGDQQHPFGTGKCGFQRGRLGVIHLPNLYTKTGGTANALRVANRCHQCTGRHRLQQLTCNQLPKVPRGTCDNNHEVSSFLLISEITVR